MSDAENPRATPGHNSVDKKHLQAFVERIENLQSEKKAIADDISDLYAEAKSNGFDTKGLRAVVRRRAQDAEKLKEHETVVDTYLLALGMI